jgi:bidirectional [NiFe] hydrogenase diaphorase subunit
MVSLTVNGKKVKARENETLLDVSRRLGISVPTLCYHPDLSPRGACRLCTVEVSRNGKSRMATACNYPVEQGIEVQTHSNRVIEARRVLIELLLARSPGVPILEDLGRELGVDKSRFKTKTPSSDCILCGLCVRACNEIAGAEAIGFSRRGTERRIGTPFGTESDRCLACGACESVCPTGAIKMETDRIRKMRLSDTGSRRLCRYMRMGLVDFMICSNGYECWRCEVDQQMEDRFGVHPAFAVKPARERQPIQVEGFTFVPGLNYSAGHLWAKPIEGALRLGFDDMASPLALGADSIKLPRPGETVTKGQVLIEILGSDGKAAKIPSPLTGTVSAVNRNVEASPNLVWKDPYGRGWVLTVSPARPSEVSGLRSGTRAREWFKTEAAKVSDIFGRKADGDSNRKNIGEDLAPSEFVQRNWKQLTEILLGRQES